VLGTLHSGVHSFVPRGNRPGSCFSSPSVPSPFICCVPGRCGALRTPHGTHPTSLLLAGKNCPITKAPRAQHQLRIFTPGTTLFKDIDPRHSSTLRISGHTIILRISREGPAIITILPVPNGCKSYLTTDAHLGCSITKARPVPEVSYLT
jgi:hypothetical protein